VDSETAAPEIAGDACCGLSDSDRQKLFRSGKQWVGLLGFTRREFSAMIQEYGPRPETTQASGADRFRQVGNHDATGYDLRYCS